MLTAVIAGLRIGACPLYQGVIIMQKTVRKQKRNDTLSPSRKRGGASYVCPECGAPTRVHETRALRGKKHGVWRRRRCTKNADHVVHTLERDCGLELRVKR